MTNPEIPEGYYCYNENGICPHWHKTENGARCDLIQEEHTTYCAIHLVWDQVKECGINRPKGNKSLLDRSEGKEEDYTCPCGKTTKLIRLKNPFTKRKLDG